MQLARVIGRAIATVKHQSVDGSKLMIVRELDSKNAPIGIPMIAVDTIGAGSGDTVMITSDGRHAKTALNNDQAPVRWTIVGIKD